MALLRSLNPYSDHLSALRGYKYLDDRSTALPSLPASVSREGDSYLGFIAPLLTLYLGSTYAASLYSPSLFLGWLTHGVIFALLSALIYRLCPPKWWELIEVDEEGVTYERFGVTLSERWRVPLSHYRGVVPVTRALSGKVEYGVALKHPDPRKTLVLCLSSEPLTEQLTRYAEALNVRALSDPRYELKLSA